MMKNNNILIINGPNLNMLGKRNQDIYGPETLNELIKVCKQEAENLNLSVHFKQTNSEGAIIDLIQQASAQYCGIIINAAGYSHTSIAIMDAIEDSDLPIIEVHLSNIFAREGFRAHSYISRASLGVISGFGKNSYLMALYFLAKTLKKKL